MASPLVFGTSDVSVNIQGHYDRALLMRGVPALVYGLFADTRPIPAKAGTRINFRRFESLPVNTTPLKEGTPPTGKLPSATDIYATLKQYGDFITFSDWLLMTGPDPYLMEFAELLGEQMGETLDTLDRDVFVAGTSVRFAGGVSAITNIVTGPSVSDLKSCIRILEGNNAKKIGEMLLPSAKISTAPVPAAFYAVHHTDCKADFQDLPGFIHREEYATQNVAHPEEYGAWRNIRFIATTNGKIHASGGGTSTGTGLVSSGSSAVDVYDTLIFARNAVAVSPLQKGTVKNIVKQIGSGGPEDPLNQKGTSGWKAARAAVILNDDFMIRYQHGVTDL